MAVLVFAHTGVAAAHVARRHHPLWKDKDGTASGVIVSGNGRSYFESGEVVGEETAVFIHTILLSKQYKPYSQVRMNSQLLSQA